MNKVTIFYTSFSNKRIYPAPKVHRPIVIKRSIIEKIFIKRLVSAWGTIWISYQPSLFAVSTLESRARLGLVNNAPNNPLASAILSILLITILISSLIINNNFKKINYTVKMLNL